MLHWHSIKYTTKAKKKIKKDRHTGCSCTHFKAQKFKDIIPISQSFISLHHCVSHPHHVHVLFSFLWLFSRWSSCTVKLVREAMGQLPLHYAPNCCYLVLEGYMLLFLYVAYFPDLGTVGNNDCCCRSNDVGNFFFLFHIYLLALPPTLLFSLLQSAQYRPPFSDSLTLHHFSLCQISVDFDHPI